jgi:ribulose-5-phosphate 4-epimerase/fuculose-1-phosphate aldolase
MNATTQSEVRKLVSAEEWQLRVDLAACYRLGCAVRLERPRPSRTSAHACPGPEHHFLINPYGLMFDEITASSLIKVDKDCNKMIDSPYPVNPAAS